MYGSSGHAYENAGKATDSSRELESAALFKAARMLEACERGWDAPDLAARLDEALRFNLRLWTFFQSELAQPEHEMPAEVRANLLRLSAFVDRRTFQLMARPERAMLSALIDINRNLASGLAEHPA